MSSKARATQPKRTRAEVNRENAKKSTGPKTAEGKAASSKNAGDEAALLSEAKTQSRHGLYSKHACIPGEDPEKLDALRADLRAEHKPASVTEEILVDELADHYWRIKRYRYFESSMWVSTGRNGEGALCADSKRIVWMIENGVAALHQRALTSAERAFHKTLNTLRQLQKDRGFVPQSHVSPPPVAIAPRLLKTTSASQASGFVPLNPITPPPSFAELFAAAQTNTGMSQSELLDLLRGVA